MDHESRVEQNIRSLSDEELLDLIDNQSESYTAEALHYAEDELKQRGGRDEIIRKQKLREEQRKTQEKQIQQQDRKNRRERKRQEALGTNPEFRHILVTTEAAFLELKIDKRLAIVTSEVAIGLNVFKDLFTVARDIVGGRSETIQKAFAKAKQTVLDEMRSEAHEVGADAIVGVDFKYNEISSGRSMLLLVGIGTAVTLRKETENDAA